jgi:hypothetical protein
VRKTLQWGKHTLTIETGEIARQSDGAVMVNMDDTVVLVTACYTHSVREGIDFLPLTGHQIDGFQNARHRQLLEMELLAHDLIAAGQDPHPAVGQDLEIGLGLKTDLVHDLIGTQTAVQDPEIVAVEPFEIVGQLGAVIHPRDLSMLLDQFPMRAHGTARDYCVWISPVHFQREAIRRHGR